MTNLHRRAALAAASICVCAGVATAQHGGTPGAAKPAAAQTAGAVSLTPKYQAGQELTFVQHTVRTDEMSLKGMGEQTTAFDATAVWKVKIADASETGVEIDLQMESIKATFDRNAKVDPALGNAGAQPPVKWDSTAPGADADKNNPIMQAFRPLVGLPLKVKLGADGNISTVTGSEGVKPGSGALVGIAYTMVAQDHVKARWGQILWIKDGRVPASVGQSWQDVDLLSAGSLGRNKITWTRTLKGVDKDEATVLLDGKYELVGADDKTPPTAHVSDASMTGDCRWDLKAGNCKSLEVHQKSTISGNAQGFETSKKSDVTVTTTRQ